MRNQYTTTATTRNKYANKQEDDNTKFKSQVFENQLTNNARNETPGDQETNKSRRPHIAKNKYKELLPTSVTNKSYQEISPRTFAKTYYQEVQPRTTTNKYHLEIDKKSIGRHMRNRNDIDTTLMRNQHK